MTWRRHLVLRHLRHPLHLQSRAFAWYAVLDPCTIIHYKIDLVDVLYSVLLLLLMSYIVLDFSIT